MKYLVVECNELERYNLRHYQQILDGDQTVDRAARASVPSWTPTGILPKVSVTYWIPETNRHYALLSYTGIGWVKTYDDAK